MPRLPDASDLGETQYRSARQAVDVPVADYAGGYNSLARGLSDVGTAVKQYADKRDEKIKLQERFDTRMGLLKAKENVAAKIQDLDPLDPEYGNKVRGLYKESYAPILTAVQHPENKQYFDESTYGDFVSAGVEADSAHQKARKERSKIQVGELKDSIIKGVRDGTFKGDPVATYRDALNENQDFDELDRLELGKADDINAAVVEREVGTFFKSGISLTPDAERAIANVKIKPGSPAWMPEYLRRLAQVESAGGRQKKNGSNPKVAGLVQFDEVTGREYGLNSWEDRMDDAKSAQAGADLSYARFVELKKVLGRDPTPGELYLAHQQGAQGAINLMAKPDATAASVLGLNKVKANLPDSLKDKAATITAGQFAELWSSKFEQRVGTAIAEDDVTTILDNSPAYRALSPDEQEKLKTNFLNEADKLNKEAEKSAKIELTRSSVDYAVSNFTDRNEAASYIKKSIVDPDTREDALTLLGKEYDRIDENEKIVQKQKTDAAYQGISDALDRNDTTAALEALKDLPPKEQMEMRKTIRDGKAQTDDPETYNSILAMKLGSKDDRKKFSEMSLLPYIGKLKPATLEALQKDQEAYKKKVAETGKAPTFDTAANMLDQRLRQLGIDTSSKAETADVNYTMSLRRIAAENAQAEVSRLGRELTPLEIEKVLDQTFMQFRGKKPGNYWGTVEANITIKDVADRFAAEEERRSAPSGSLLAEAMADFHAADPTFVVTGEALNEWLKRKMDEVQQ